MSEEQSPKIHKNVKKTSNVGQTKLREVRNKVSMAKSIGGLHIAKQAKFNPQVAIQKIHLFRKQKEFLVKQQIVFERRAEEIKKHVLDIDVKIKDQKAIARHLLEDLESEKEPNIKDIVNSTKGVKRARPAHTNKPKTGKVFQLGY